MGNRCLWCNKYLDEHSNIVDFINKKPLCSECSKHVLKSSRIKINYHKKIVLVYLFKKTKLLEDIVSQFLVCEDLALSEIFKFFLNDKFKRKKICVLENKEYLKKFFDGNFVFDSVNLDKFNYFFIVSENEGNYQKIDKRRERRWCTIYVFFDEKRM